MDIKDAGIDDLVFEIFNRCDHGIINILQKNYESPNSTSSSLRCKGYPEICIGLAHSAATIMTLRALEESRKDLNIQSNKDLA